MGSGIVRRRFTTVAVLDRPNRIEVTSYDSLFECFEQIWTFEPAGQWTRIEHRVDLRLNSTVMNGLLPALVADSAKIMVKAYMRQAEQVYGRVNNVLA
jgi:coenzyme Q-binding protein COQ10